MIKLETLCNTPIVETTNLLSVARELLANNDAIFERKAWNLHKQITVGVSGHVVVFYDFKPNTAARWMPTLLDLVANDYKRVM